MSVIGAIAPGTAVLAAVVCFSVPSAAGSAAPKDAGLRYGQALGALEVCYGSKLTDKAKALESAFQGSELDAFKTSAAGVYQAWVKVRGCTNQKDPNTCKIIMDRSCQLAEKEIGPNGDAMPDLVEFLARPKP